MMTKKIKMSEYKTLIEIFEKDGRICSVVKNPFMVDPTIAASMCYVVYNTLIDSIPEDKQIEFEKLFIGFLGEMMENGHNYMTYHNE